MIVLLVLAFALLLRWRFCVRDVQSKYADL